jgi:hypothetical protein
MPLNHATPEYLFNQGEMARYVSEACFGLLVDRRPW